MQVTHATFADLNAPIINVLRAFASSRARAVLSSFKLEQLAEARIEESGMEARSRRRAAYGINLFTAGH